VTSLSKAIGWVLAVYYSFIPNLGIAIILLTFTVMLVLFPLTAKQTRSMIAMQRMQPEIKKIQQRYKDDKQKQNEEVMKFYQENKINPLSGCLPLLMQMPIFFALFECLKHINGRVPKTGKFNDLFQAICPHATAANKYACPKPVGQHFLGMDLSVSAAHANTVAHGILQTAPYFILVGLVILTGWYQTRQTMSRQTAAGGSSPMNAQAQMIGKVMPIAFGLISLNFASGLVLYFVTSNTWRIGQQQLVLNKIYEQEHAKERPVARFAEDEPAKGKDAAASNGKGDGNGGGSNDGDGQAVKGRARQGGRGANGGTSAKAAGNNNSESGGKGGSDSKESGPATNASGRVIPGTQTPARARPNPNTAQKKRKRKR
jgi:YidC/Oxa1 family membrane protein insertase